MYRAERGDTLLNVLVKQGMSGLRARENIMRGSVEVNGGVEQNPGVELWGNVVHIRVNKIFSVTLYLGDFHESYIQEEMDAQ